MIRKFSWLPGIRHVLGVALALIPGAVALHVCFASEAVLAAEAGEQVDPGTPPSPEFEFRDNFDGEDEDHSNEKGANEKGMLFVSAQTRCYRTVLEQGRELEACNQAIAEASVFDDRGRAAAYANRALIRSHSGDLEAALIDIERALEILPDVPDLLINRGNLLWRLRRYDEASGSYQLAIDESSGRSTLAYYNRVFVHRVRGDIDLAARDLESARRLRRAEEQFAPGLLFNGVINEAITRPINEN